MKVSLASAMKILMMVIGIFLLIPVSHAHESRPAYLELKQQANKLFDVQWRRPARGDRVLRMQPLFPKHCISNDQVTAYIIQGASVERWKIDCGAEGLIGQSITIRGLKETITDVLVRVEMGNGAVYTRIVKGNSPAFIIEGEPSTWKVIKDYILLGVEHILGGIDHLLFVLCLLLIVKGSWLLVKTITAFTIAHSMTLGMATLGYVNVPQAPVEAVIAMSILFLAAELMRQQKGERDIALRAPWIVAFIFGLLHGFGFAGALSEVGLPQMEIPLALLTFNVGVEAGQLLFIAVVIIALKISSTILIRPLYWARPVVTYGIGGISAFWVIERVGAFL
jgi:hydrogenase/urease accessory protein HupE